MKLEILFAKSEQLAGLLQQKWGEITHNQFSIINGKRKSLLGKIRELHVVTAMTPFNAYNKRKDNFKGRRSL